MNRRSISGEPIAPSDSPDEAFKAYVNDTRARGDLIDDSKNLSPWFYAPLTAGPAAIIGESFANTGPTAVWPMLGSVALSVAIGVARISKSEKGISRRLGHHVAVEKAIGGEFELLRNGRRRDGKHDVMLHTVRPLSEEYKRAPLEFVRSMARRAQEAGIEQMTLPRNLFLQARFSWYQLASERAKKVVDRTRWWLGSGKSLEYFRLYVAKPEEWLKLTSDARRMRTVTEEVAVKVPPLETLMDKLAKADGRHPLLATFKSFAENSGDEPGILARKQELQQKQMLDIAKTALAMRFHGSDRRLDNGLRTGQITTGTEAPKDAEGNPDPTRMPPRSQRVSLSANIVGDQVATFTNGAFDVMGSLAGGLGVSEEQICIAMEQPDANPNLSVKVIEYLTYLHLSGTDIDQFISREWKTLIQVQVSQSEAKPERYIFGGNNDYVVRHVINRGSERPGKDKTGARAWQAGIGAAAAAATIFGVLLANQYEDARQAVISQAAADYVERTQGLPPGSLDTDHPAVDEEARRQSAEYDFWQGYKDAREQVLAWGSFDSPLGRKGESLARSGAASSQSEYGTGSTERAPIRNDWFITPHGGMETGGYWASATSSTLQVRDTGHGDSESKSYYWQIPMPANLAGDKMPVALPDRMPANLEVARQINASDVRSIESKTGLWLKYVRIPVLNGTEPVAANLDGKPLKLLAQDDGTYVLAAAEGDLQAGRLTYWLIPATITGPRAVGNVTLEDKPINPEDTKAWDEKYSLPTTGDERVRAMAAAIHEDFDYNMNSPFQRLRGFSDWNRQLADKERANCNLESTAVTVTSPNSANIAAGYLNRNGSGVLSTNELHQWVILKNGELVDGTPYKNIPADQRRWLDGGAPDTGGFNPNLPVSPVVIIGSLAALAALSRRKQLAEKVDRQRTKAASRAAAALEEQPRSAIADAIAVAGAARYSRNPRGVTLEQLAQGRQPVPATTVRLKEIDFTSGNQTMQVMNQLYDQAATEAAKARVGAALQAFSLAKRAVWQPPQRRSIIMDAWNKTLQPLKRK